MEKLVISDYETTKNLLMFSRTVDVGDDRKHKIYVGYYVHKDGSIIGSAISSETPIALAACKFTGMDAALEQVAKAVIVAGKIFFQKAFIPFFPAAINAYKE